MRIIEQLLALSDVWAGANDRSLARLATKVANNGQFFDNLKSGRGCTVATFERFLQFFRDTANWPDGLIPVAATALLDNFGDIASAAPASTGQMGEASRDGVASSGGGVNSAYPSTNSAGPPPRDGEVLATGARNRTAGISPVDHDGGRVTNGQPPEGPKGAAVRGGRTPGMAGPVASPCTAPTHGPLSPTLSPEGERGISGAAA